MPNLVFKSFAVVVLAVSVAMASQLPRHDASFDGEALIARAGLPRFFAKLKTGGPVTVAYLGGSITQASDGWAARTTAWLRATYPAAKIIEINAGLGGTGADLGAARLAGEVLVHRPDLVFVEFAVNGVAFTGRAGMRRAAEGIVRQIQTSLPGADIVFVHTVAHWSIEGYRAAPPRLPPNSVALDAVAAHYALPAIFFGPDVVAAEREGRLRFKGDSAPAGQILFSRDGVHPIAAGAELYAKTVCRALARLATVSEASGGNGAHAIRPAALEPDAWERVSWIKLDQVRLLGGARIISAAASGRSYGPELRDEGPHAPALRARFPRVIALTRPGDGVEVEFEGSVLGLFDVGGPFSGRLIGTVDGQPFPPLSRFSHYNHQIRPQVGFLPEFSPGRHRVRLMLDAEPPDKSAVPASKQGGAYNRNEAYLGGLFSVSGPPPPEPSPSASPSSP